MDEILQRFIEQAPVAVMVQATAARAIADSALNDIYERHADSQYTRDLTFAAVSRLLTQVVFRSYPSVNAAYRHNEEISVSVTSVYKQAQRCGDGGLASVGCRDGLLPDE